MKKIYMISYIMLSLLFFFGGGCAKPTDTEYYYVKSELPTKELDPYDASGIKKKLYKGKYEYNPLFIANDAINYYIDYFNVPKGYKPNPKYKEAFFIVVDWFIQNSVEDKNSLLFAYKFEYNGIGPPWYSALTQARVAKVFTYAYRWSGNKAYLDKAKKAIAPIFLSVENDGFLYKEGDLVYFEEYTKPRPNHVLNGHMSVVLDLFEMNKVFKDEKVTRWIKAGTYSLKKVLPRFELAALMLYGGSIQKGSRLSDGDVIENTYNSYDLIHLDYLNKFYQNTKDQFFKDYFFRYYATIGLSNIYNQAKNVLSPINGAFSDKNNFVGTEKHRLEDAFANVRKDPTIYASSRKADDSSFVVNLGVSREISEIKIRYHWSDYPRLFRIDGLLGNKWISLVKEDNWTPVSETPTYYKQLSVPVRVSKIRYYGTKFSKQQRLLIDYFFINEYMSNGNVVDLWKRISADNVVKLVDLDNCFSAVKRKYKGTLKAEYFNREIITSLSKIVRKADNDTNSIFLKAKKRYVKGKPMFDVSLFNKN